MDFVPIKSVYVLITSHLDILSHFSHFIALSFSYFCGFSRSLTVQGCGRCKRRTTGLRTGSFPILCIYGVRLSVIYHLCFPLILFGEKASYIRRLPSQPNASDERIRVVRSDLKLRLDRMSPYTGDEDNDDDSKENSPNSKNKKNKRLGWHWAGEFEHEEGILECFENDLNDFEFRRNRDWKGKALKFTGRAWKCSMVIGTPD